MTRPDTRPPSGRYLPLSGAVFTTLMVLGAAAFPMPPGGDVSPAANPTWLAAHHNAVIAQSYVRALAAVAFMALTVAVAAAIRAALPAGSSLASIAVVGGVLSGGLLLVGQAATLAAALFIHAGGGGDTTRAFGQLQTAVLDMSAVPAVLLFAATGITAQRTGLLPRWLTVASLAGVPIALIDAASYDGGPFESVGLLGLLYFLAWSLLTGVQLYRSHREESTPTAAPGPAFAH